MSRKSGRLEKENDTYKRKHEATNANIAGMVHERENLRKDRDAIKAKAENEQRRADKLMNIIRGMQDQGRKVPPTAAGVISSSSPEQEESEYSHEDDEGEDEDEDEDDESEEYEDEDSDDDRPLTHANSSTQAHPHATPHASRAFGPERPPPQQPTNGH